MRVTARCGDWGAAVYSGYVMGAVILTLQYFILLPLFAWGAKRAAKNEPEGWTMVVVTHEMRFARQVADQVLFLDGGVVVEQGPPAEVLVEPREPRTRQFLQRLLEPL